ncbi:uncharacterized protein LOC124278510 [Haliotis rubra]|uniref:uncharacterized protein LOC124278510 n=1 Tax=Haliotis rubra TaxID=36100 RepID=UPI001EE4F991|nr:uncharacterized protein LOC124278510 [Haliotis rubra]
MSMICQRILVVSLLWLHVAECKTVDVTCSSNGFAYSECNIPDLDNNSRVIGVTKKKQLSSSECIRTVSFGYTETKIWVSDGCRAEFYVQFGIVQPSSSPQDSTSVTSSNVVISTDLETSTVEQSPSSRGLELFSSYGQGVLSSTWSMSSLEDITPSSQDSTSVTSSNVVISTDLETSTVEQSPSSRGLELFSSYGQGVSSLTWTMSSLEDITPSSQDRLTQTHTASPWTLDVSSPYGVLSSSYNLSATLSLHDGSSSTGFLSQTASVAPLASAAWSDVNTTTSLSPTQAISSSTPLNKVDHTDSVVLAKSTRTCFCRKRVQTERVVDRNDYIKQIVEKLQVNVATLSKTVRKKTSAKDDRPSSVTMGYVGIVFLGLTALLIVLPDVCTLCNINNT